MNVLVVYKNYSTFVQRDIELLSKHYTVTPLQYPSEKHKIKKAVLVNDVVISWFASAHALRPFWYAKRFGKRRIVVVGGYDASDIRGYGMFDGVVKKTIVERVYRDADVILPVDDSLREFLVFRLPSLESKIRVLPTGHDGSVFKPDGVKKNQVLTVCHVNEKNWVMKGINTFVESAKYFPYLPFIVVGKYELKLKDIPENVTFTGWKDVSELIPFYQQSKVFALLSMTEGLSSVLCEAMLCECIPVSTGIRGCKTVQGELGRYVPYGDVEKTVEAVRGALSLGNGVEGRSRIMQLFSLEKRETGLIDAVEG